jgi:hypothetical protein
MNRRGFLSSILALGAAPAVVRAASLMPWKATESGLLVRRWVSRDELEQLYPMEIGRLDRFVFIKSEHIQFRRVAAPYRATRSTSLTEELVKAALGQPHFRPIRGRW